MTSDAGAGDIERPTRDLAPDRRFSPGAYGPVSTSRSSSAGVAGRRGQVLPVDEAEVVEQLLSGPRGRRLCWGLVAEQAIALPSWRARWQWEEAGTPAQLAQELREAVEASDFAAIAGTNAEFDLLGPFAASVNAAMHWQPSDQVDQGLEDPGVADALRPVAGVVAHAPGARWWLTRRVGPELCRAAEPTGARTPSPCFVAHQLFFRPGGRPHWPRTRLHVAVLRT